MAVPKQRTNSQISTILLADNRYLPGAAPAPAFEEPTLSVGK